MIFVGCLTDKTSADKFMSSNSITEDCVILRAEDSGETAGYAAIRMSERGGKPVVEVHAVEYSDELVCELLLRAAVNYGERRGAQTATAAFDKPEKVMNALGFRLIDGEMSTDVNNVVHMCKSCHNNGN